MVPVVLVNGDANRAIDDRQAVGREAAASRNIPRRQGEHRRFAQYRSSDQASRRIAFRSRSLFIQSHDLNSDGYDPNRVYRLRLNS